MRFAIGGMLFGMTAGVATGVLQAGGRFTFKALGYGIIGGLVGFAVGAAVGAVVFSLWTGGSFSMFSYAKSPFINTNKLYSKLIDKAKAILFKGQFSHVTDTTILSFCAGFGVGIAVGLMLPKRIKDNVSRTDLLIQYSFVNVMDTILVWIYGAASSPISTGASVAIQAYLLGYFAGYSASKDINLV